MELRGTGRQLCDTSRASELSRCSSPAVPLGEAPPPASPGWRFALRTETAITTEAGAKRNISISAYLSLYLSLHLSGDKIPSTPIHPQIHKVADTMMEAGKSILCGAGQQT